MSRRVYSDEDLTALKVKGNELPPTQDLSQKIIDYIPVEIVTAWTGMYGILNSLDSLYIYWAAFIILGALVPIQVWRFSFEPGLPVARWQIVGATGAFIAWVFAMGGPFTKIPGFEIQHIIRNYRSVHLHGDPDNPARETSSAIRTTGDNPIT